MTRTTQFAGHEKVGESVLTGAEMWLKGKVVPRIPRRIETYHLTMTTLLWSAGVVGFSLLARDNILWLAGACARFDRVVIDRIVNTVGAFGRWLASWLRRAIDSPIVDGAVNGVGKATTAFGEFMRATQTGLVQNYLLVAAVTVVLLLVLFLVRS